MDDLRPIRIRKQWTFDSVTDTNDNYYRSVICSTHVHQYIYALSVVGIILSFLMLLSTLCAAQFLLTIPPIITLLIFSLTYIGNHKAIPILYVPLIVSHVVIILCLIGFGVFVVGYGAAMIFNAFFVVEKNRKRSDLWIGVIVMCFGFLMIIGAMFLTYLTRLVYRAMLYLKVVIGVKGPPFQPDYTHVY